VNRAFLIIIGPALFVALLYIGVGRRLQIPVQAGVWLLVLCGAALLIQRWRSHSRAGR
jgi:hypothetical protein